MKRHKVLTKDEQENEKRMAERQNEQYKAKLLTEFKRIKRIESFKEQQINTEVLLEKDETMLDNTRHKHMLKSDLDLIRFDLSRLLADMKDASITQEQIEQALTEI